MATLYEHAGGDEALHRLEEIFYTKALADPILRPLFPERRPNHVEHLTWFTAESFGGPARFTEKPGFDHIIRVHRHLKITDEQRQRFADLPDDEPSVRPYGPTSNSAPWSPSRTPRPKPKPTSTPSARSPAGPETMPSELIVGQ